MTSTTAAAGRRRRYAIAGDSVTLTNGGDAAVSDDDPPRWLVGGGREKRQAESSSVEPVSATAAATTTGTTSPPLPPVTPLNNLLLAPKDIIGILPTNLIKGSWITISKVKIRNYLYRRNQSEGQYYTFGLKKGEVLGSGATICPGTFIPCYLLAGVFESFTLRTGESFFVYHEATPAKI